MPVGCSPRVRLFSAAITALIALACMAPSARAQINYTEPPDLSGDRFAGTPVGTVALGLNTIRGTITGTYNNGIPGGDNADAVTIVVPPGLVVTQLYVVITNYVTSNLSIQARATSISADLANTFFFAGNGTSASLISTPSGVLTAGTHPFHLYRSAGDFTTGTWSYSWEWRIVAAPDSNDTCQVATPITPGSIPFDTTPATTDGPATNNCGFSVNTNGLGKDLWYTFTPADQAVVTLNTCGASFDTVIAVYTGPCGSLVPVVCNDDEPGCGGTGVQSALTFIADAGTRYLVRLGGYANNFGTGTLVFNTVTTGACCNRWTGHCTVRTPLDCTSQGLSPGGLGTACSPATCKACPAEFNGNGTLEVADIFAFLNAWFAGCP